MKPNRRQLLQAACAVIPASAAVSPPSREFRRGGMVYRPLGRTGMNVSLLSFGSHTDPADRVRAGNRRTILNPAGQAKRDRILAMAFDRGINLMDVYESEGQWKPAAAAVKGRRDKVLVSLAHEISVKEIDECCRLFSHIDLHRFHTAAIDDAALQNWDTLRKAKEAGKIRAIGIATHVERTMIQALTELDGLDFLYFPYNFIHARADYSEFLPKAIAANVGLIAMKPLASGSIARLDPRARQGAAPEFEKLQLWRRGGGRAILPAAVSELTKTLDRLDDETLCMAAMKFVYAKPFVSTAIAGMFDEQYLLDNCLALDRYLEERPEMRAALDAAATVARLTHAEWLPTEYRWLEEQWLA